MMVKTLWHYEDHQYIYRERFKKEGDPVQTSEVTHIEDFVPELNPFVVTKCFLLDRQEENHQLTKTIIS